MGRHSSSESSSDSGEDRRTAKRRRHRRSRYGEHCKGITDYLWQIFRNSLGVFLNIRPTHFRGLVWAEGAGSDLVASLLTVLQE